MTPIIPRRIKTIRTHKENGGRIAAVLPIHYPRALFRAFDILPVEVWGPPHVDATLGSAHLQPYVCSIVRNALAYLLSGNLDLTDLIVVPHACDSLQGFASILIDFVKPTLHPERSHSERNEVESKTLLLAERKPILPIYLPRGTRDSDLQFLAAEFRSIYRTLTQITQRNPSDAELMVCIAREEHADDLLAELHRNRSNLPLSQSDLYRLIRSREYLPAEKFIEIVESVARLVARPARSPQLPIILSGIVPEPMTLFDALDAMNAYVVADDFACCGRRLYPRGVSHDPFTRMAERILAAPPDSTRGSAIEERAKHLESLAKTFGAKGIVFYDVKFCEPELFYHPTLRKALSDCGIPSVVIEFDLNDPLSQQTQTRLEAFMEMIASVPSPL
ncbi:MAG: 2-hydroxyacyl-CoA dehydratase [Chloroflexi bacterium]|nr:2-hydroxyacyl-CoA dehydratase [Chloroflexota bacterium]